MVNDVTTNLKSRKNKLTLKLSDGCASVSRYRPISISYLKSCEKVDGSSSLPQTPTSCESSQSNKQIKRNICKSEEELYSYQLSVGQDWETKKLALSDSFQQLKRMSEWSKLPTPSSSVVWNNGREAPLSSTQHRRLLMMSGARNNLSLDSQKDSPEFQATFARFIFPSHVNKKATSEFHQSDPGGLDKKNVKHIVADYHHRLRILHSNYNCKKHNRTSTTSPNANCKTNVIESPLFSEAKIPSASPEESWKTLGESTRVVVRRSANLNLHRQTRFHSSARLES